MWGGRKGAVRNSFGSADWRKVKYYQRFFTSLFTPRVSTTIVTKRTARFWYTGVRPLGYVYSNLSLLLTKDLKTYFIWLFISGDRQGFNSFSAVGEYANSVLAHSPKALNE